MRAKIVIGLGYGDEGKGMVTSSLTHSKYSKIVVRFSGGQQAGHTIYENGVKHIASNFGAGVLNDIPTYFTQHCTIYPNTICEEKKVLENKGIENPTLIVHPLTLITTPSDVAYNRVTEKKNRHGSCGLGVGATMSRNKNTGYKLFAIDSETPHIFYQKLKNISSYYRSILPLEDLQEFDDIEYDEMLRFEQNFKNSFIILSYEHLKLYDELIFEGSQGILLDKDHGVFPNVTYSNTTSKNALKICKKLGINEKLIEIYYVSRCYQTRHGNGWMSNENKDIALVNFDTESNKTNEWQGNFKVGEIDYDLLEYSLNIDNIYSEHIINKHMVVTCLDQRPGFKFSFDTLSTVFKKRFESENPFNKSEFL